MGSCSSGSLCFFQLCAQEFSLVLDPRGRLEGLRGPLSIRPQRSTRRPGRSLVLDPRGRLESLGGKLMNACEEFEKNEGSIWG